MLSEIKLDPLVLIDPAFCFASFGWTWAAWSLHGPACHAFRYVYRFSLVQMLIQDVLYMGFRTFTVRLLSPLQPYVTHDSTSEMTGRAACGLLLCLIRRRVHIRPVTRQIVTGRCVHTGTNRSIACQENSASR